MIQTGQTIAPNDRAAWLAERRKGIGASEAAAALGLCRYSTPIDLWQRKLGLAHDVEENEAMWWGNALEDDVIDRYQLVTGRAVVSRQVWHRHPDIPYMTATVDGIVDDGRLLEIKTTGRLSGDWGEDGSDQIPDEYLVQVQHQLAVTGRDSADVAVFHGLKLNLFTLPRHDAMITNIQDGLARFWGCVQTRTPPDWGRMTASNLLAIHPECQGEIEADVETAALIQHYEAVRDHLEAVTKEVEVMKTRVLFALGGARDAVLPDGRKVRRYIQDVPAKTVTYVTEPCQRHYFRVLKGRS